MDRKMRKAQQMRKAQRVEDHGRVLQESVRRGAELTSSDVVKALQTGVSGDVLALIQQANVPEAEKALQFLKQLQQHDQEARETLDHFILLQEGDVALPDAKTAQTALSDHLKAHPHHLEVLDEMYRPVYQLVPIYDHDGAGFQRIVNSINAHGLQELGYNGTYVSNNLQESWGMNEGTSLNVIGWQVAITEGARVLPEENSRFLFRDDGSEQRISDQLKQWQAYCLDLGIQLCDKVPYTMLQMHQIHHADTSLVNSVLDSQGWTILKGDILPGGFVPCGRWYQNRLIFEGRRTSSSLVQSRFRPSIVVEI